MNKSAIAPATEIVVSLMSQYADTQGSEQLQNDPRTYIYKTTHINIPEDVNVAVVQNSDGVVNLILPYYEVIGHGGPDKMDEDDMSAVSGGAFDYDLYYYRLEMETDGTYFNTAALGKDIYEREGLAF